MFFYLVMLVFMGWVEQVYERREPPDDDAEAGPHTATDWDAGFILKIPRFYRRPSRIPVEEPDDTPLIADAYLRAGGGG